MAFGDPFSDRAFERTPPLSTGYGEKGSCGAGGRPGSEMARNELHPPGLAEAENQRKRTGSVSPSETKRFAPRS